MSYVMVIDQKRCVGCYACVTSCKVSNGTPPGMARSWVEKSLEGTYPNVRRVIVPKLCNQCDNPPCVEVCPAGATTKREDGVVVIDKEVCIGCQSCIAACPYGARSYRENDEGYYEDGLNEYEAIAYLAMPANTVDKCDFCVGRTPEGEMPQPACVQACVAGARFFGTVEEMDEFVASSERDNYRLAEEEGTGPNVVYLSDFVNVV